MDTNGDVKDRPQPSGHGQRTTQQTSRSHSHNTNPTLPHSHSRIFPRERGGESHHFSISWRRLFVAAGGPP
eukprot:scaffold59002_cov21-Tisochrysis_lutea.AAC.1